MKFLYALALLATMTVVSVQGQTSGAAACTICLQNSIQALPLCSGLNITMGDFNPSENPAYAKCLCSTLDGAWIDSCTSESQCGKDIVSFKSAYAGNIQAAGLSCGAAPTFTPANP